MSVSTRYADRFAALKRADQRAFMPFTLLGWPDKATCLDIIQTMIDSGASALELGLPFRDPVSDGPVIQAAAQDVLNNGFRVADAWEILSTVRARNPETPITLMVYYNMVLAPGMANFFASAATAGLDGVLIVDLPPEVADKAYAAAHQAGVHLIFILSPLTTAARMAGMAKYGGGFLYIVSRLGITGTEERYDTDLKTLIDTAKAQSDLPLCVGFGISTPEQARTILALGADGVITGSRIIQLVQERGAAGISETLRPYLDSMRMATEAMPSLSPAATHSD